MSIQSGFATHSVTLEILKIGQHDPKFQTSVIKHETLADLEQILQIGFREGFTLTKLA